MLPPCSSPAASRVFVRRCRPLAFEAVVGLGLALGLAACGTRSTARGRAGDVAPAPAVAALTREVLAPVAVEPAPCRRTLPIADTGGLATAIAGAQPGDCILLGDGDYGFPVISKTATAAQPITIRAAHLGRATVNTGSVALLNSAYVLLEGLRFASDGNITVTDSAHCRISRFRIEPQDVPKVEWVDIKGSSHHIRIDHNDFGPKSHVGNMLMLGGTGAQVVQYNEIDHNYFHDITYGGGNGWETIRAGLSYLAPSKAFTVIEYNLFRNTAGDPETISIKSSDNEIRYNTFRQVPGEMTLRHGNRNRVHGNYMIGGSQGIRICGADHLIYNNYLAGVKAGRGIFIEGGDGDGTDVPGKQHYRVYRTQVVNNTLVDGRIDVGGSHPLEPVDCIVANNISTSVRMGGTGTRYAGNISSAGATTVVGEVEKLAKGSPAIDAAAGQFDFVTDDIDGQPRDKNDVGADELSEAPSTQHGPLTERDVGPLAP